jgi:hypothetical protein
MSGSPSAVVIPGDGIYVFHQGYEQDGNIWYSHFHFSNSTWDPDKQVPNVRIGGQPNGYAGPSAIAFPDGRISVYHQGDIDPRFMVGNNVLFHFDDLTSGNDMEVPNGARLTKSPSAVVLPAPAGAFSVFHNGSDEGGSTLDLWYSYFDGTNWQAETQVKNVGMSESPSAVVIPGDGIYVFHQGITGRPFPGDPDGNLWWSHFHFDNSTWDPDTQVKNVGMSIAPSAIVVSPLRARGRPPLADGLERRPPPRLADALEHTRWATIEIDIFKENHRCSETSAEPITYLPNVADGLVRSANVRFNSGRTWIRFTF